MGFLARLNGYVGTADMSGIERRREANLEYAAQLIESELTYWYGAIRTAGSREAVDEAIEEIRHLKTLQEQARG